MGQAPLQPQMISAQDYGLAEPIPLGQVLQTTLDVYDLLKRFHQVLQAQVGYHHFQFTNPQTSHRLVIGTKQPFAAEFSLAHHNDKLGEVTFTKSSVFSTEERQQIQDALSQLIYPLRNAISYHEVVIHSVTCPLTQLGNRSLFDQTIRREMAMAERHQSAFTLLMLDIDDFKQINDSKGHLAGDAILREMGQLLRQQQRHSDYAFRYAGDEFILLLSQSSVAGACQVAERIRQQVEHHEFLFEQKPIHVTVSIGLAHFKQADTYESLFQRMDSALYAAKNNGKNQIVQL